MVLSEGFLNLVAISTSYVYGEDPDRLLNSSINNSDFVKPGLVCMSVVPAYHVPKAHPGHLI